MDKPLKYDGLQIGATAPLTIIAGPCVIEDADTTIQIAATLKELSQELDLQLVFKASFDKANRTSIHSFRGPGMEKGLKILARVKSELGLMILSDVHESSQVDQAAQILDIIQIPAFLCRQTDFLLAAARSLKPINIKKGQFLAPWDMANTVAKIRSTGNQKIMLTERGATFGYNNLVVDFRGIQIMQSTGCPVIFDATHSVQLPGGDGTSSGGQREFAPVLARAAVAAGADGIFIEVHPDPDKALCDGPNSLPLDRLRSLFLQLIAIRQAIEPGEKTIASPMHR
jgi:2-dehydro-3-deoxyphosphooctonate aldolase (KDO 8-P synthase)